jgi:hypothetical protein
MDLDAGILTACQGYPIRVLSFAQATGAAQRHTHKPIAANNISNPMICHKLAAKFGPRGDGALKRTR